MRRTLIILVSVAVNLLSNAGTDAYVISKAGAAAGSYAVSSSGSYSGSTAHAGVVAGSGTYGGHQLSTGDAAQSIAKAGAITHSGLHYGGAGSQTGGSSYCPVCKHQSFPGPNGSIHDYKLASAVSTAQSSSSASAAGSSTYQHPAAPAVINLPAAPGNIYSSKPATSSQSAAASSSTYDIGHLSPSLVASFPGPSGSIHDSKPATAAAVAVAGATASSGSNYHVAQPVPVVQPAPAVPNPQLSQIIPVFPGKPGSIYSSKPVATGHVKETGSSSGYHDESGSITNIPDHVKTSPSCRYVPGAGGSCGSNVAVEHNENVASNAASAVAGAITGADYHHHVVVPVPERELVGPVPHNPQLPQIIPVFPGNPGSIYSSKPLAAGSQNVKETNVFEHNASNAAATSSSFGSNYHAVPAPETDLVAPVPSSQPSVITPVPQPNPQLPQIIPVFPGQSGSIHSSKPVGTGSQHVKDESASHSASSGNYHDESGSITNIPTHANSGSSCRYVPGLAGNNCGSSGQLLNIDNSLNGEVSNSGGAAEAGVSLPSVHPETPLSGTYYINKPSVDLQTPENSFSGQIPCGGGSSCGSTVNQGLSHDAAHLSGGIVFQNEDGSYHGHTTSKPVYKNAENGNYAVSSNSEDNKGILIGPGTGHLPIEESKPFGTQGAFGGSAAFSKSNSAAAASNQQTLHSATIKEQPKEPFGTQGAFGGSTAFSKSNSAAAASNQQTLHSATIKEQPKEPFGTQGAFGGSAAFSKSNSASDQQQLATQGDFSNGNSYGDKSGSYGGHGTFGGSKTGAASVAFAKAGSNEIKAAPAGLIDVRNIDDGRLTSGSFVKSSSSAHSFASASSSAVSYSGSF